MRSCVPSRVALYSLPGNFAEYRFLLDLFSAILSNNMALPERHLDHCCFELLNGGNELKLKSSDILCFGTIID